MFVGYIITQKSLNFGNKRLDNYFPSQAIRDVYSHINMFEVLDNVSYVAYFVGKFIKKTWLQALLIIAIFLIDKSYKNFFSKDAINKEFERVYFSYLNEGRSAYTVMKRGFKLCKGDNTSPSNFFTDLSIANVKILNDKSYKNIVEFKRIIINEKPSTSLNLTSNIIENQKVKEGMRTVHLDEKYTEEQIRKKNFLDENPKNINISVYYKEGLNHKNFEENVRKFPNRIIPIKVNQKSIQDTWKGQIVFIKNLKTNSYLIFREIGGVQSHKADSRENQDKIKILVYYGIIKSKNDIREIDKDFYNLMDNLDLFDKVFI